jgi:hypothetical protein
MVNIQALLFRQAADSLHIVAVGVAYERPVIRWLVLTPQLRLVQGICAARDGGIEESAHSSPVARSESYVRFTEALAGDEPADPEVWLGRDSGVTVMSCAGSPGTAMMSAR